MLGKLFGFTGKKEEEQKTDNPAELKNDVEKFVKEFITKTGLDLNVVCQEVDDKIILNITGPDSAIISQKGGLALEALGYITNKVFIKRFPINEETGKLVKQICVDMAEVNEKREKELEDVAFKLKENALNSKRPVFSFPMNPRERRIIHLTLKDDKQVTSKSLGDGHYKKIKIFPLGASKPRVQEQNVVTGNVTPEVAEAGDEKNYNDKRYSHKWNNDKSTPYSRRYSSKTYPSSSDYGSSR